MLHQHEPVFVMQASVSPMVKACLYGTLNVVATVSIVFANKLVMSEYGFKFPVALTWLHSIFTAVGMSVMCSAGMFEKKVVALHKVIPVAVVYVGFIVFNNLSLKVGAGRQLVQVVLGHNSTGSPSCLASDVGYSGVCVLAARSLQAQPM